MLNDILNGGPIIIGVLAILVLFSIASWAIIFQKLIRLRALKRSTQEFIELFWETGEMGEIEVRLPTLRPGPLPTLFREGYAVTQRLLALSPELREGGIALTTDAGAVTNISRTMRKVSSIEIMRIERDVGFLATAGATAPFIGLFGTVWGIMTAFQSIGHVGSTSLAVVAPGISEALVTTAIGLAVAIPAVIGFNYIQGRIRSIVNQIDTFCSDFLAIVGKIFEERR